MKELSEQVQGMFDVLGIPCMYNSAECQIWRLEHGGLYKESVCVGCPHELGCAKLSMTMKEFNQATESTQWIIDIDKVIIITLYHTFRIKEIIHAKTVEEVIDISRSR